MIKKTTLHNIRWSMKIRNCQACKLNLHNCGIIIDIIDWWIVNGTSKLRNWRIVIYYLHRRPRVKKVMLQQLMLFNEFICLLRRSCIYLNTFRGKIYHGARKNLQLFGSHQISICVLLPNKVFASLNRWLKSGLFLPAFFFSPPLLTGFYLSVVQYLYLS